MNNIELFENEFNNVIIKMKRADKIILYGNSVVACIIKVALDEMGFSSRIFDKGKFVGDNDCVDTKKEYVVLLCSVRHETRKSMEMDSKRIFPKSFVTDFYPVYFHWITSFTKRECKIGDFADTLALCRDENLSSNVGDRV